MSAKSGKFIYSSSPQESDPLDPIPQTLDQDILSFFDPSPDIGNKDHVSDFSPLKPSFQLGIVDPESGFLTEPSLFPSLQPTLSTTLEPEQDYTSLLDIPLTETAESLAFESSEITEVQGFLDSDDEVEELEINRSTTLHQPVSFKDNLLGSFAITEKEIKSLPRLIRQSPVDSEPFGEDTNQFLFETKSNNIFCLPFEEDAGRDPKYNQTRLENDKPPADSLLKPNMALSMENLEAQVNNSNNITKALYRVDLQTSLAFFTNPNYLISISLQLDVVFQTMNYVRSKSYSLDYTIRIQNL